MADVKASCGGCDRTWTGLLICHCAACHETFSCIDHFDAHRAAGRGSRPGYCLTPDMIRRTTGRWAGEFLLKLNRHGVWVGVEPTRFPKDDE
jgi:hypothetical protein